MHSDVRADVQARPAASRDEQQRIIDRWRQQFNHVRPHQALDGKTPAEVYKVRERRKPLERPYAYPKHFYVRRITAGGQLCFRGDHCAVGTPFTGLEVGVEIVDASKLRVWLHDVDLGIFDTVPVVDDSVFDAGLRVGARSSAASTSSLRTKSVSVRQSGT
jgi:hypothetical protein